MKKNVIESVNIAELLKDAQKCKGEVLLLTSEGDQMNLKSTLSQYVVVVLASNKSLLEGSELVFDEGDAEQLKFYVEN